VEWAAATAAVEEVATVCILISLSSRVYWLTCVAERQGYAVREALPFPDKPPYTAHLGNLAFDVTQGNVEDFLQGCDVTSVRIVEDKLDRKPKGFGYVEFGTLDGLKKALTLTDSSLMGRNVRISIAEPRKCLSSSNYAILHLLT